MNKNVKRMNFIFKMSIIGLVILMLHFCTIFISRMQLINNTEAISSFTKNQALIQRVVKNELSNFERDLTLENITQELEAFAGALKPSFDLSSEFNDYIFEWNSLKSIIYDYRETNDDELYYKIIIQSELVWHNGDKILDSLNSKMHKNLNVFWLMLILLLISIICFVFLFVYIWKTVRGSLMGLALRDPLTNCFNRNYFNEYYLEQLKLYNRYGHVFSVAMLDLDNFKNVNDQFGHDVGDLVLKRFVKLIHDRIRSSDILVRYGGEEFLILFPDTELIDAKLLSKEILKYVSDCTSFESGKITTSIGLASIKVNDYTSKDVIKDADIALYQAKANGKNQVTTYLQI